jgi:hypothetical protein
MLEELRAHATDHGLQADAVLAAVAGWARLVNLLACRESSISSAALLLLRGGAFEERIHSTPKADELACQRYR